MRRAWLIRHGESTANAGATTSDPGTIPLTERGHEQARAVAAAFSDAPALIVTSRYLRTQETAAPTIARFGSVPTEEWNVHEFTYLAPDRCAEMSSRERRPLIDAYWNRCDPLHVDGEGAESFAMLLDRVGELLDGLRHRTNLPFIAIYTHGQLIRAALWTILGNGRRDEAAMRSFRAFDLALPIENGAIVRLVIDADGAIYARVDD